MNNSATIPESAFPLLLDLSNDFLNQRIVFSVEEIADKTTLGNQEILTLLYRLSEMGVVRITGDMPNAAITLRQRIVEIADQIKNRPPPNYWANCINWFTSRRWTLPLVALVVGTPVIYCWVEIAKSIAGWIK